MKYRHGILIGLCSVSLMGCSIGSKPDILKSEREVITGLEVAGNPYEFKFDDMCAPESVHEVPDGSVELYLYLGSSRYYPIEFPEGIDYITDSSKYIYATDSSITVTVISDVDMFSLAEKACIYKAEAVQPNLVVTSTADGKGRPERLEAALLLDEGKAVIVRTNSAPDAYDMLVSGLGHNRVVGAVYDSLVHEQSVGISMPSEDKIMIPMGLAGETQRMYDLENGDFIVVSRELRKYEDAIAEYEPRVAMTACTNRSSVYMNDGSIYYAEVGDYVVGIYKVNFNTVLTCFGKGAAAKDNARGFLLSQSFSGEQEGL